MQYLIKLASQSIMYMWVQATFTWIWARVLCLPNICLFIEFLLVCRDSGGKKNEPFECVITVYDTLFIPSIQKSVALYQHMRLFAM